MSCYATLKEKGLRLTRPRQVILDYIHERGTQLTAEEIINHVHSRLPRVNKSTVYRTLDMLEKNACVFRSEHLGRTVFHHAEVGHTHHLVCSGCGRTFDYPAAVLTDVGKWLAATQGFQLNIKQVVLKGLCRDCQLMEK
jgi:Fur family transcriptional regulator, ferric uptake regulator